MTRLSLCLLGTFSAQLDGRLLRGFEADKVRALLAYLAVENKHPHRRSVLAGLFWPDHPENAARASLRNALYNLRSTLQNHQAFPPYLLSDQATIQFNTLSSHWVDVHKFEEKIARGIEIGAATDLKSRLQSLKEAVELYQGDFLSGFSFHDCPEFEQWQLSKQELYQGQVITALTQLAATYEEQEELALAITYSQRLVQLAPWEEGAHRRLMRLFAVSGQRSLAMNQFAICQQYLEVELEVQLEPATIQLYEQIRHGSFTSPAQAAGPAHNLPIALAPLIGRTKELDEIDRRLADPACRLLTVSGPGGSGKTYLAIEAARRIISRYRHGVYIVSLEALLSTESAVMAIVQALGLTFPQASNPRQLLLDYLNHKEVLIILDNCEHLPEAAELALDILHHAIHVKILATSRTRLNIAEEQLLILGGLGIPQENSLEADALMKYGAIQLFCDGARRVIPLFDPPDHELPDIVEICRLVDGMPLAILQAASWCSMFPLAEIAANLRQSCMNFLRTDWRGLPDRQRSMQAVFDYSYQLLNQDEQKYFVSLGIFRGSFSLPAAQAVTKADIHLLKRLVDKTMLHPAQAGRFELHELLRQYTRHKLDLAPAFETTLNESYVIYYASALKQLALDLQGSNQLTAVHSFSPDLPDALAAWDCMVEQDETNLLEQALDGLCGVLRWYNRYSEGAAVCQRVVNRLATGLVDQKDAGTIRLFVKSTAWQAYFANMIGENVEIAHFLDQAFDLAQKLDLSHAADRAVKAFLFLQAGAHFRNTNLSRCWEYWFASLEIYRELNDRWHTAQLLEHLGTSSPHQDHYQQSRAWLDESLSLRRALGDQTGMASALQYLSLTAAMQGDFERMERLIQESLEINRKLGNPESLTDLKFTMSVKLAYSGNFAESCTLLDEIIKQYRQLGLPEALVIGLEIQGWIKTNLGEYESAEEEIHAAIEIIHHSGYLQYLPICKFGLGQIQYAQGQVDQAVRTLADSVAHYRQFPPIDEMGMVLTTLAGLEARLGQWNSARDHWQEGLITSARAGSWQAKVHLVAEFACLLAEKSQFEAALEYYALATRYPYLGNSRYWWDVAGKRIKKLTRDLSDDLILAAEQRGILRDLDQTFEEILKTNVA